MDSGFFCPVSCIHAVYGISEKIDKCSCNCIVDSLKEWHYKCFPFHMTFSLVPFEGADNTSSSLIEERLVTEAFLSVYDIVLHFLHQQISNVDCSAFVLQSCFLWNCLHSLE